MTLLVLRVEGNRAVSVNLHGTEEAPVHRSAARELARLADLEPSGHVAWLDRRMETVLTAPGAWPALLRHDLEVLHAGGGSRMAPSLGLVDFDSPWLLDPPPGRRFDTWLISPAAGIARGAALRAVGIEPDGWSFGAALFDLGRRGVPVGLLPVAEPRLLRECLPALPELRTAEVARLVRRGYGRKWVTFWMLARHPSLAALRGWLAPGPDDPDRAALEALRPVLPREKDAMVDVLIPTLGRPEHLRALLEDLASQTLKPRRVIVVEQGDPHPGLADGGFPFEVRLLSLPRPGACRARNAGLREVRSEWVLLLDDDVRLRPGLIERLVSVARAYGAGAVNARVHLPGQEMGGEPGPPRLWPSFSSGAALVSARTLLESGGFDEHLDGGYGEDYELGVRLRLLGASVLYDAAEPILHLKAPAGGFRAPLPLPWDGDDPTPRPSPFILYSRRKHLTPEMRTGYRLYYTLSQLAAAPLWRWPAELRRIARQWERSEHWAARLREPAAGITAPRLIVVAYAVAPGPGGPESQVNLELLRALAERWPAGVTVISGGSPPALRDGTPLSSLPGWRIHALGESGASGGGAVHRLAEAAVRSVRRGGLPARAVERVIHRCTGQGIKMASWQSASSRILEREIDLDPDAVVWSRALPYASVAAAHSVRRRRRFRWIVNVNDPMPASVWPGLYASDPVSDRRTRERFEAAVSLIDALTFPSAPLRDLETSAFPALARLPSEILPHIADTAGVPSSSAASPSERLRIVFGGTLRKDRARPELAEALARIGERVSELDLTFVLARPTPFAESYAASLPVAARVVVEEDESALARALSGADLLLDLECEADRPLLLTKVVNYLAASRPVWALCAPGGTTWELIETEGWGYASALGDVGGAARTLLRIHGDWSRGELSGRSPSPALVDRFSARRQVEDLHRLIGRLSP